MRVERHIAASPREEQQSPLLQYASLHRTIERGLASDATWAELTALCVELGKKEEAISAYGRIREPGLHMRRARNLLVRHGLIDPPTAEARKLEQQVDEEDLRTNLLDEAFDTIRFLLTDHMPVTIILATITFPLVIGLGGFLVGGSSWFVFSLLAMIPSLAVLGLVGGLGRRILLEACDGYQEPPALPAPKVLARDGLHFLRDATLLGAVFFGPVVAMSYVPATWGLRLALAIAGLVLMPLAMAIRQLGGSWSQLQPVPMLRTVVAGGWTYIQLVATVALVFTPALAAGFLFSNAALWLTVSITGPLLVVPLFVTARLLGRVLDMQRDTLGELVGLPERKSTARLRSGTLRSAATYARGTATTTTRATPTAGGTKTRQPVGNARPHVRGGAPKARAAAAGRGTVPAGSTAREARRTPTGRQPQTTQRVAARRTATHEVAAQRAANEVTGGPPSRTPSGATPRARKATRGTPDKRTGKRAPERATPVAASARPGSGRHEATRGGTRQPHDPWQNGL